MRSNLVYPAYIIKTHRGLIIFGMFLISFLQFLIIWLMSSLDYAPIFEAILNQLPPQLKMLFNQEFMNRLSIKGAAAFGFNHPLVLTLLGIVSIIIPARHIAGEIEFGTLELLLSYPLKRSKLIITLGLTNIVILFCLICAGLIGSMTALVIFNQFSIDIFLKLIEIGVNLWLLFCLIASYSLLISVFGREGGKAGMWGAAISLIFYFTHFIASIWESLKFTHYVNIFYYYQPQKLMFNQQSFPLNITFLSILTLLFLLFTLKHFEQRDIP